MIKLQQNRYLWLHFAGLAFVPLLLDICLAGLASAGPALPFRGQFWAIALFGIVPGLVMQWVKPFYIFSLPPSALKPSMLSEDQRRCLQIFKSWQIKALAVVVTIFLLWLLVQLYTLSPQLSPMLTPQAGLVCAAIAFFTAATFTQISVSAARALLIGPDALKRVSACDESVIAKDFLIAGFRVNLLLPTMREMPKPETNSPTKAATQQSEPPIAQVIPLGGEDENESKTARKAEIAIDAIDAELVSNTELASGIEEEHAGEEGRGSEADSSDAAATEIVVFEELPHEAVPTEESSESAEVTTQPDEPTDGPTSGKST